MVLDRATAPERRSLPGVVATAPEWLPLPRAVPLLRAVPLPRAGAASPERPPGGRVSS